ncbi:PREDICTED: dirigent protein 10-like [Camelina sativa]|uniref:Dirigent protein n=1 Tax=Camelina sativa TaxID=90675 RepID=A0ABM0Z574_CAMSA|nr:PREDICTED: dirigent protein 10-like [Camelina sativa]
MAGQKILSLLVIALVVTFAAAARLLDEEDAFSATTNSGSASTAGSGSFPSSGSTGIGFGAGAGSSGSGSTGTGVGTGSIPSSSGPLTTPGPGPLPIAGSVPGSLAGGGSGSLPTTGPGPLPAAGSGGLATGLGGGAGAGPALGGGSGAGPALGGGAGAGPALGGGAGAGPAVVGAGGGAGAGPGLGGGIGPDNTLVFFMHDILGGSNPTARAVTGVVANPALSGQLPFAKTNGANLAINNGVPSDNNNNGIVNNNNVPFLVGLGGTTANILQENGNGNNNINGFSVASGGQLPSGSALQMLMFGTMTVIDDELTEGHELGSGLLGKAQGYYVASAVDGTSQTLAFTAMFESGGYEDSISFFGVLRTAVSESHLGVMGGTGKYVNARGFAIVKTFTGSSGSGTQQNQPHQFTDGLETVLQCTVYLSY